MKFPVIGFVFDGPGQQHNGPRGVIHTRKPFPWFCGVCVIRGNAIDMYDSNWHTVDRGLGEQVVEMIEDDLGKGGCSESVGSGCRTRHPCNQTKQQWYK